MGLVSARDYKVVICTEMVVIVNLVSVRGKVRTFLFLLQTQKCEVNYTVDTSVMVVLLVMPVLLVLKIKNNKAIYELLFTFERPSNLGI